MIKNIVAVVMILALGACASLTGPGRQQVKIDSTPQGAEVKVGGKTVITPAVVELKGKSEYYVTATKDGYGTGTEVIGSEVRILASVVGNIFNLSGVIGAAIDFFGTGAAYKLDDSVNVKLMKKSS